METRGKKRKSGSELQEQISSRRARHSASHTATTQIPSNDIELGRLDNQSSGHVNNVVQNISDAIIRSVEPVIRQQVEGHLATLGITQPATTVPDSASTVVTSQQQTMPLIQSIQSSILPSIGISTASSAVATTAIGCVTQTQTSVGTVPSVSGVSTSPSGNQFSIPALSLDISRINDQNSNTSSFTSVALPLHATVNQKVKERIWANEFVELSTVFSDDVKLASQVSLNFTDTGASVSTNSRKRFITIEQWTDLFAKYASVFRVKYTDSSEALAKYSDTVRFIAKSNGNWHFYDSEFRKLRQSMNLPWGMIQHELYFKALIQKPSFRRKPEFQNSSDSGNAKKFCFKFNRGEHCNGCSYQHACSFCGGTNHAVFRCYKKSNQGKRGQQSESGQQQKLGSSESGKTGTANTK